LLFEDILLQNISRHSHSAAKFSMATLLVLLMAGNKEPQLCGGLKWRHILYHVSCKLLNLHQMKTKKEQYTANLK
jgi:hypothetical protein